MMASNKQRVCDPGTPWSFVRYARSLLFVVVILNIIILLIQSPFAFLSTSTKQKDVAKPAPVTPLPKQLGLSTTHTKTCSLNQTCKPRQHVFYLKTHKTGSTTMYSIFAEYCRSHDLLPLMPRGHHINQSPPVRDSQLLLQGLAGKQKFDMVFNHHVYSPPIFKHLHEDTVRITTVREPYDNFISSFTYFRKEGMYYLKRIPGEDPLMELLKNRPKYEARDYVSYTNNRQSMDLGFDIRHSFNDSGYISKFIRETEKRFDLVLITDFFHESLVIMKRFLHWTTQDILYFPKLKQKKNKNSGKENLKETKYRKIHATFSRADMALYTHFLDKFKVLMRQQEGLEEEVAEFEAILEKLRVFCDSDSKTSSTLHIPPGKWSDAINLLPYKCKWLKTDEVSFTLFLQKRQSTVLSFQ